MSKINELVKQKSEAIDISREVFNQQEQYRTKLQNDYGDDWKVFPQGSVRLGTVIKSPKADKNEIYDIDLVAHHYTAKHTSVSAKAFKMQGKPLVKNQVEEKKPCWTIKLDNSLTIDVTPAINDADKNDSSEKITRKQNDGGYDWKDSNPIGYYNWFKQINQLGFEKAYKRLQEVNMCKGFNEGILKPLVRTDLQRAIQVLKYMRDISFNKTSQKDYKPVSIVITTIVTQIFKDLKCDADIEDIIREFIAQMQSAFKRKRHMVEDSVEKSLSAIDPIKQFLIKDNMWYLPNPTDAGENFLDRWNEGEEGKKKAVAFFEWIKELNELFSSYDKLKHFLYPPKEVNVQKLVRKDAPQPYFDNRRNT